MEYGTPALRVERGRAGAEELAAVLTALLLAGRNGRERAAGTAPRPGPEPAEAAVGGRRLEIRRSATPRERQTACVVY
ncbi:hypothetical protein DI273_30665 [Streptomyces violascens]|nr:hypothetical protein DI273_30665 [Streptomyces violascens]